MRNAVQNMGHWLNELKLCKMRTPCIAVEMNIAMYLAASEHGNSYRRARVSQSKHTGRIIEDRWHTQHRLVQRHRLSASFGRFSTRWQQQQHLTIFSCIHEFAGGHGFRVMLVYKQWRRSRSYNKSLAKGYNRRCLLPACDK